MMADSNPLYKRRSKAARTLGPKEAKALNELVDLKLRRRKAARRSSSTTADDSFEPEMTGDEAFARAMRIKLKRNRALRGLGKSAQQSHNAASKKAKQEA